MRVTPTSLPEVLLLEPKLFEDERGYFFESFNNRVFEQTIGRPVQFVQDNCSRSVRQVLRGLHYQVRQSQAKLVRVTSGAVFDVAVDLRRGSPTFGQWTGFVLSADDRRAVWIPEGFGHGFLALTDLADVAYKATDYYAPQHERTVLWNDPDIGVAWPSSDGLIISAKDRAGTPLRDAELFDFSVTT
ncbi:MAG: dTDP-4-dehydrorhamnose 3,5-epimerase [Vicinamibacterales bacterium]